MINTQYKTTHVNDSTPKFIKETSIFNKLREQHFKTQMNICNLIKERGNTFYKLNDFESASQIYQELYSFFEFKESKNDAIYQVQYCRKIKEEQIQLEQLQIATLNNISLCYLKQKLFQQTIQITTYILKFEENSPKALYRRAKAYLSINPLPYENLLLSINDLKIALQYSQDIQIIEAYNSAIEIFQSRQQSRVNLIESANLSFEIDHSKDIPKEIKELKIFTEKQGQEIFRKLQISGKTKEANEFLEQLNSIQKTKNQLEKISRLDFNKPKPYFYDIIHKLGVNTKQLQNEFGKIQNQHLQEIRTKLQEWKQCQSECHSQVSNQGNQGEQKSYQSSNCQTNYIYITIGLIIFVMLGVIAANF